MKRWVPLALALTLGAMTLRVPAATAAAGLSPVEHDELELSYNRLTSEFYKKVDTQTAFDAVRAELIAYLKANGIAKPVVPEMHAGDDTAANLRELDREVNSVANEYGSKFGTRNITYEAITGLLSSVKDRYTVFLSPKDYAALNEGLEGGQSFGGVGLTIRVDDDTKMLRVNDVVPDAPADKAGVQPDDIISDISGHSTKGLTVDQDSKLLRGQPGTAVRLTIVRDGQVQPAPIQVVRATIHAPSVYSKMLADNIGYVTVTVFGLNTAQELTTALNRLESEGAKAYVLDLRNNGGGYLNSAIDVSSKFVPSGPIVTVEARAGNNTEYDAEDTAVRPRPLAVLVNKGTASASEITSGAIQDNGVGTLVGTRTFGKGVVQTIYPMPDGSAIKITTARYLTPHGHDINTIGIQPDISTEENKSPRYGDVARDSQLEAAVSYLQGKIAQLSQQ